jgi:carbon-monoxide dehydrogenase small subunit
MTHDLVVNGHPVRVTAPDMTSLADVLRDHLGLRGTKVGCSEGRCGACTVHLDGAAVNSCLVPVALAAGRPVTTVEGISAGEQPLHPVQDALVEHGGVQCGACIPGVVMSLCAHLAEAPVTDEGAIRGALIGNVCRCTGYHKIVEAAAAAAERMREDRA